MWHSNEFSNSRNFFSEFFHAPRLIGLFFRSTRFIIYKPLRAKSYVEIIFHWLQLRIDFTCGSTRLRRNRAAKCLHSSRCWSGWVVKQSDRRCRSSVWRRRWTIINYVVSWLARECDSFSLKYHDIKHWKPTARNLIKQLSEQFFSSLEATAVKQYSEQHKESYKKLKMFSRHFILSVVCCSFIINCSLIMLWETLLEITAVCCLTLWRNFSSINFHNDTILPILTQTTWGLK